MLSLKNNHIGGKKAQPIKERVTHGLHLIKKHFCITKDTKHKVERQKIEKKYLEHV